MQQWTRWVYRLPSEKQMMYENQQCVFVYLYEEINKSYPGAYGITSCKAETNTSNFNLNSRRPITISKCVFAF